MDWVRIPANVCRMSKLQLFPPPLSVQGNLQQWCATYRVNMIQPVTQCIIDAFKHSWKYGNYHDRHLHWSNKSVRMTVKVWIFDDKWVIAMWPCVWPTTVILVTDLCVVFCCMFLFSLIIHLKLSHILEFNELKSSPPVRCLIRIAFIFKKLPPKELPPYLLCSYISLLFQTRNNKWFDWEYVALEDKTGWSSPSWIFKLALKKNFDYRSRAHLQSLF